MKRKKKPTPHPNRPVACVVCTRRKTTKPYDCTIDCWDRFTVETWQCVYCGAVQDQGVHKSRYYGTAQIVLAPGELQELREDRRQ